MAPLNPTQSAGHTTPPDPAQASAGAAGPQGRGGESSRLGAQGHFDVPRRPISSRPLSTISESGDSDLEYNTPPLRRTPPASLRRGSGASDDSMHSALSQPAEEEYQQQFSDALETLGSIRNSRSVSPAISAAASRASAAAATGAVAGLETISGSEAIETLTQGVKPNEAGDLTVDQQKFFLNSLAEKRPAGGMAAASAVEFVAKAIVSGIHFGVVQSYVLTAAGNVLDEHGVHDPVARAAAQAALVGPSLAVAHYVAEVILRTAMVSAAPRQQVPTDVKKAFPEDSEGFAQRRATMTAQQSAAKPGQPIGDAIGLASFMLTNGIRAAVGGDDNQANVVASALGGGFMALGHTLVNFATETLTAGGEAVPSHVVAGVPTPEAQRPSIPEKVGKAVPAALKATAKAKDSEGKDAVGLGTMGNVVHEIFVARNAGLTQGELIKQVIASQTDPESPSFAKRFAAGAAGPLAILGLGFFPDSTAKGLSTNRGNTAARFAGTTKAVMGLNPLKNSGTTQAVIGTTNPDAAFGQMRNLLAAAVDGTHQTLGSFLRIPASVTIDLLKLAAEPALFRPNPARPESHEAAQQSNV